MTDLTKIPDIREPDEEPPEFGGWEDPDQLLEGDTIRERMVDVILQLREPTKVATIAERAECDTETAREYLQWFAEMGMVREHPGRPVNYSRNASYLRWRRIEHIREEYSEEEIVEELTKTVDTLQEYRERFAVKSPDGVSLIDPDRDATVEELWETVSEWKTLERRADVLDAARREGAPASSGDVESIDA